MQIRYRRNGNEVQFWDVDSNALMGVIRYYPYGNVDRIKKIACLMDDYYSSQPKKQRNF